MLQSLENDDEIESLKWKYATLSNCYLAIGDVDNAKIYEDKLSSQNPLEWERNSFNNSKQQIQTLKK